MCVGEDVLDFKFSNVKPYETKDLIVILLLNTNYLDNVTWEIYYIVELSDSRGVHEVISTQSVVQNFGFNFFFSSK